MLRAVVLATIAMAATGLGAGSGAPGMAFTSHYEGRGAEGLDDIWRGTLDRPGAGVIAIRVETDRNGTARGFVFVSRDTLERSFGATVTGHVEGETIHLSGPIDVGPASGTMIDLTMRAGRGTIRARREVASSSASYRPDTDRETVRP